MHYKEWGMTMVEMILSLTVAGVIGATVVPAFVSLEEKAYEAKLDGAIGAVHSGATLAHAAWLVQGGRETVTQVTMEDAIVTLTYGWPAESGIAVAAGIDCTSYGCYSQANGIAFTAKSAAETGEPCFVYFESKGSRYSVTKRLTWDATTNRCE